MSEVQLLTVDFTQEDNVLEILPYSSLRTSENLAWNGVYVQQHQQPAWQTPEHRQRCHTLMIHTDRQVLQTERVFDGHKQQERLGNGNNVAIIPSMIEHQATWNQQREFVLLFIDPDYLIQVTQVPKVNHLELIPHCGMPDPFIEQIGRSLNAELTFNQFGSRLLVDSLTTALSIHLLRHYSNWHQSWSENSGGLSQHKLRQAIAYINEHLAENLALGAIADELKMSQYHFSRLFKQSSGVTPYQYVIRQRLKWAKYLLATTTLSITAIAKQVGFAHQNQLTIQFRKLTGTTPSNYRKHL